MVPAAAGSEEALEASRTALLGGINTSLEAQGGADAVRTALLGAGKLGGLPAEGGTLGAEGALEAGELAGETGITASLEATGGALEGLGTLEDATGILAPLGILTNIAGGIAMVGGLVGGGVGFIQELRSGFNHAQDEMKHAQNLQANVAGRYVMPTSNHANLQNLR